MICFFLFDEGSQNGPTGAGSVLDETGHKPSLLAVHASESMSQNSVLEALKLTSPSDTERAHGGAPRGRRPCPSALAPAKRDWPPCPASAHPGRAAKLC